MLKRNNKKTSKKPKSPPSHKSVTNKRARMMCPRRKIVPTARNLVSDSQRGLRLGMHSRGKQPAQSWTDIEGPPGAKGHASAVGSEANEARRGQAATKERGGERTGHRARRVARAGPEHPLTRRAPRVPADLQRPRTRLRRRPGCQSRTRRGGRFPSGPAGEMDLARVAGPGVVRAARGSPLNPCGLGWRLCDGGALRPAGRRPYPGPHHPAPGPAHTAAIAAPATTAKPGSRFVTGARLPAQSRR